MNYLTIYFLITVAVVIIAAFYALYKLVSLVFKLEENEAALAIELQILTLNLNLENQQVTNIDKTIRLLNSRKGIKKKGYFVIESQYKDGYKEKRFVAIFKHHNGKTIQP